MGFIFISGATADFDPDFTEAVSVEADIFDSTEPLDNRE
jgi:hypothetical protein